MLKENLDKMLKDIKNHNRDRDKLLEHYISIRLNASLKAYYDNLMQSYKSLLYKDELKIARAISK